jgi:hypothetical protein
MRTLLRASTIVGFHKLDIARTNNPPLLLVIEHPYALFLDGSYVDSFDDQRSNLFLESLRDVRDRFATKRPDVFEGRFLPHVDLIWGHFSFRFVCEGSVLCPDCVSDREVP